MTGHGARVLLIGCGEVGSRHLQAVASLPGVQEIEVVDPRPEASALGRARLEESKERSQTTRIRWLTSLADASSGGDVCLVATRARGRCQLVREIAEQLGYSMFLIEKLVAPSIQEIDALLTFVQTKPLAVWVNFKSRALPFHRRLKQRLDPAEPLLFSAIGGNHGLATNGIHLIDLFAFFDEAKRIDSAGSRIDPILHPSKRGDDLFDLSGTLHGYTEKGSHVTVSYASDQNDGPDHISVVTRRYRCIVDPMQRWAVESDADSGWAWRPVPFEDNVFISHMTKAFVSDILASGRCALPTLEESLVAHRFVLGELQPHFSRLLDRAQDLCPVT